MVWEDGSREAPSYPIGHICGHIGLKSAICDAAPLRCPCEFLSLGDTLLGRVNLARTESEVEQHGVRISFPSPRIASFDLVVGRLYLIFCFAEFIPAFFRTSKPMSLQLPPFSAKRLYQPSLVPIVFVSLSNPHFFSCCVKRANF